MDTSIRSNNTRYTLPTRHLSLLRPQLPHQFSRRLNSTPYIAHPPLLSTLAVTISNMVSQPKVPPSFGDRDVSGGILATTILVTVSSIIIVGLRFATRIWIVKRVGLDDWCILFACVSVFMESPMQIVKICQLGHPIGTALVVVQIGFGLGRPSYYLTPHQFQEFLKYSYGEWLQVGS